MRIALFHAPPWQIPDPGIPWDHYPMGPPRGYEHDGIRNMDYLSVPYGLLSIAAQAMRAGHQVEVINLSGHRWSSVEAVVAHTSADIYGMTCLTVNRRGVAAVAQCIKDHHPSAHVTVGGPHVTALPLETLAHYPAIDSVVKGEGEATFLELVTRLEQGAPLDGMPGLALRTSGVPTLGPVRERIADLDELALPQEYFPIDAVVSARGCPGRCSFCAGQTIWGGKVRFHSVRRIMDMLHLAVGKYGLTSLAFKDDTFTASQKRAIEVCRAIRRSGLNFHWSCDTRVDHLDDELLREMRLAGCQRISLGVESANRDILARIAKRITPEMVVRATELARRYGFEIRYYMIAGNRGETLATYQESLDFIAEARPNEASFCLLSAFPGTLEFELLQEYGLSTDVFFDNDFPELEVFGGRPEDRDTIRNAVLEQHTRTIWRYGSEDRRRVLRELPELPAAHFDLATALMEEGEADEAAVSLERAASMGFPVFGLLENGRACLAQLRGDPEGARLHLEQGLTIYDHAVIRDNLVSLAAGRPLCPRGPFEITLPDIQPILPAEIRLRVPPPVDPHRTQPNP